MSAYWIAKHLGPSMKKSSKCSKVAIHTFDENRDFGPKFIRDMEESPYNALDYIDGFQFHAYSDKALTPKFLDDLQDKFPDKEIWYSEVFYTNFIIFNIILYSNLNALLIIII